MGCKWISSSLSLSFLFVFASTLRLILLLFLLVLLFLLFLLLVVGFVLTFCGQHRLLLGWLRLLHLCFGVLVRGMWYENFLYFLQLLRPRLIFARVFYTVLSTLYSGKYMLEIILNKFWYILLSRHWFWGLPHRWRHALWWHSAPSRDFFYICLRP